MANTLEWIGAIGGTAATVGTWLGPLRARWTLAAAHIREARALRENNLHRQRFGQVYQLWHDMPDGPERADLMHWYAEWTGAREPRKATPLHRSPPRNSPCPPGAEDSGAAARFRAPRASKPPGTRARRARAAAIRATDEVPLPVRGEVGNGRSRGDDITPTRGTAESYLRRRLKRDRSDLYEKVAAGEQSARMANG